MSLSGISSLASERRVTDSEDEETRQEEEELESAVLSARPPDGGVRKSFVVANETLDFLDQLVDNGTITSEKAGRLKKRYNALYRGIESSRAAENALLRKSHELQMEISQGRAALEKGDSFPESDSSETSKQRQLMLTLHNELLTSEHNYEKQERITEQLQEEIKLLQYEYRLLPKKEEIEEKRQALNLEVQIIQDEIDQRVSTVESLKETIEKVDMSRERIEDKIKELENEHQISIDELAAFKQAPGSIPREIDKINKAIVEDKENIEKEEEKAANFDAQFVEKTDKLIKLKQAISEINSCIAEQNEIERERRKSLDSRTFEIESSKNAENRYYEERIAQSMILKRLTAEIKLLHGIFTNKTKERDKDTKALKRAQIQLKSSQGILEQQLRQYEQQKAKVKELEEHIEAKKKDFPSITQEVEILRKSLGQTKGIEEYVERKLDDLLEEEKEYKSNLKKFQAKANNASKETLAMMKKRDNNAKEFYKMIRQKKHGEDEIRKKNNQIEDQQKRVRDLEASLTDFAQAYEIVKTERNIVYSQIQSYQQLSAEMKEKLKVLQNETEILHNAVDSKTKILARSELALANKTQDRDSQHSELTKVQLQQEECRCDLERQREILCKLTQQINSTERTLNRLNQYYEHIVQSRNDTGLQLIERNEEVCVFHEKINVQASIAQKGITALAEKEEVIRYLKMEVTKLEREININRTIVPEKEDIEIELEAHRKWLIATKETVKDLEDRAADARDPKRIRLLPGKDPSCGKLREKSASLQAKLNDCEQQFLEKELLLEQVTRLLDRTEKKANGRKETTFQVGNKVNHYQSKLREVTRKMMSLISELSVQQSLALHLNQVLNEKEAQLETAYQRLEAGEAPDDETEMEIIKSLQKRLTTIGHQQSDQFSSQEGQELSNGVYTTAEARPNAYVPDSDTDLPLPKPYGRHAPFKPSKAGANIRHIRKPHLPPIQI